jgi:hypothetical protein
MKLNHDSGSEKKSLLILLFSGFLFSILNKYSDYLVKYSNIAIILVLLISFIIVKKNIENLRLLCVCFVFVLSYILSSVFLGDFDSVGNIILNLTFNLVTPFIAYELFFSKRLSSAFFKAALICVTLLYTYIYIYSFYKGVYFGVFLDGFFELSSRNYWVYLIILISTAFTISEINNDVRPSIIPFFICVFFAFQALGRSNTVYAVGMLLSIFVCYYRSFFYFSVFILGIFSVYFHELIYSLFEKYSNFSTRGLDSPRWNMVSEYLTEFNVSELFIGSDFSNMPTILEYLSPHNLYIDIASKYGLVGFVFIFFIIFVLLYPVSISRKNIFIKLSLLFLVIRSFTDSYHFSYFVDIFYFYIVFCNISILNIPYRLSATK